MANKDYKHDVVVGGVQITNIIIIRDSKDINEKCLEDYNPLHNPIY